MKVILFRFQIIACLLFGIAFSFPEQAYSSINVRALCDSSAWIGDSLSLKLQYTSKQLGAVQFPIIENDLAPDLAFFNAAPKTDTIKDEKSGLYTVTAAYPFSIYSPGYHTIPPITFTGISDSGETLYTSDSLIIHIKAPVVDTTKDFRDIKTVAGVSFRERFLDFISRNATTLLFSAVILALIGLGVWFYIKRKRKNDPLYTAHKTVLSPLQQALLDLKKLKEKKLWQQNQIKAYYTELTDILRVFISANFNINATEMTSDELLDIFKDKYPQLNDDLRDLRVVLTTSDLVKFAKNLPLQTEHEECFRLVYLFVEKNGKKTEDHE